MPKPLILAAEVGYRAIPGAMAVDITSWGEVRQIVRELKKPEVKQVYSSLIVDTVDILSDLCQKYICNQLGISTMGEGGWANNSWSLYKKEFEETFRTLSQLGYAIIFLSHDKEKTIKLENGVEYQQIGASVQSSALAIIENMSDIIGYAHPKVSANGSTERVLTLRSLDNSVRCGCRFSRIAPEIPFSYEALSNALAKAIDDEAQVTNNQFVTDAPTPVIEVASYDHAAEMAEFKTLVKQVLAKDSTNSLKITSVVDKFLGKGKKVAETAPEQAELVHLINLELREDLLK